MLAVGVESIYSGSVIEYLSPGDVLELVVFANYALNLTLGIGVAATLTVKNWIWNLLTPNRQTSKSFLKLINFCLLNETGKLIRFQAF